MTRCLLYKLTFSNGKIYIGKTTRDLKIRLQQHANLSKHDRPEFRVHHAWKKYGAPDVQILAYIEHYDLDASESRAIAAFKSFGINGYNMTAGGETSGMLGKKHSVETRFKMSGKECSVAVKKQRRDRLSASWENPEFRLRMSNSALQNWKNPDYRNKVVSASFGRKPMLGKVHSDATKLQMSLSRVGRPWSDARRAAHERGKNV